MGSLVIHHMRLSTSLLVLMLSLSVLEASTSDSNQVTEVANADAKLSYADISECIGAVYQRELEKFSCLFPEHLNSDLRQALDIFISSVKLPLTGHIEMRLKTYNLYVRSHFVDLKRRLTDLKTKWSSVEELIKPLCTFLDVEDKFLHLVSETMAGAYHEYSQSRNEAASIPPVDAPLNDPKHPSSGFVTAEVPSPKTQIYPLYFIPPANVGSLSAVAQESTEMSTFEAMKSSRDIRVYIDAVFKREFEEIDNLFPAHIIARSELYDLFDNFLRVFRMSLEYQPKIEESVFELCFRNNFSDLKQRLNMLKGEWFMKGKDFTTALYHLCDVEDAILDLISAKIFQAFNEYKRDGGMTYRALEGIQSDLATLEIPSLKFNKQDKAQSTVDFEAATTHPLVLNDDHVPLETPDSPAEKVVAIAPAPLSLKLPNELMSPIEEFRLELRHVLEMEWRFGFENLADFPQCSYLLKNIHAFPQRLTGAGIDYNGTFDEIMASLNLLLELYVREDAYLAVSTQMEFDPEMYTDIFNMVYPEVFQQYYTICSRTLLKYFPAKQTTGKDSSSMDVDLSDYEMVSTPEEVPLNDHIPLSGYNNYLLLAARVGIDYRDPMSFMEDKYAATLRKYGYDIGSPEFQNFLNEACMRLAVTDTENDETLPPAIPLDGRLESSPPKPSISIQSRLERNSSIIAQLRMLLDAPGFLNEFKLALVGETGDEDKAELYADQISLILSDLVTADRSSFKPTPSSPTLRYMHLIIKEAVELKCDEISGTMCFDELSVRVSAAAYNFIVARIFPSVEKASADASSALSSAGADTFSPIKHFPSSPVAGSRMVTFSDEQTVENFDDRSLSDKTITEPVTSASDYRLIAYNEENVPEFPFNAPNNVMVRPAYITETADYLCQHGETSELHLDQRIKVVDLALSIFIEENLSAASIELRDSVYQLYFKLIEDAFKSARK